MSQNRPYTLLTGCTGLVGRYLLKDLIKSGKQLAVVVRNGREIPEDRVNEILEFWKLQTGDILNPPVVIQGNVSEPQLGIDPHWQQWIRENCSEIVHNAAILSFTCGQRDREPWLTNLNGTRYMLDLCRDANIEHFHYVSTAYVCGDRPGTIMESDLDCGQGFRNDYEQSKFEAEQEVRSCPWLDRPTIYRPAVIAGDSQTGYTSSYHGLYLYLRIIATLVPLQQTLENGKKLTPIDVPVTGDEPRNLVTVDWVSATISSLINNPAARGLTFHVTPDRCVTAKEVIGACCDYFGTAGVRFVGPNTDRNGANDFAAKVFESVRVYQNYETSDPLFDKSNLERLAGHIPCPDILTIPSCVLSSLACRTNGARVPRAAASKLSKRFRRPQLGFCPYPATRFRRCSVSTRRQPNFWIHPANNKPQQNADGSAFVFRSCEVTRHCRATCGRPTSEG